MTRLTPSAPCETPRAAQVMYDRGPRLIAWDEVAFRRTLALCRALKANSRFDPRPDREWDVARQFTTPSGRKALDLNCNDFCPRMRRLLHDNGFPMEAMDLLVCEAPEGLHMVLALHTDCGDYLVCNSRRGLARCDDPRWHDYRLLHREAPGRPWVKLGRVSAGSLEGLLG